VLYRQFTRHPLNFCYAYQQDFNTFMIYYDRERAFIDECVHRKGDIRETKWLAPQVCVEKPAPSESLSAEEKQFLFVGSPASPVQNGGNSQNAARNETATSAAGGGTSASGKRRRNAGSSSAVDDLVLRLVRRGCWGPDQYLNENGGVRATRNTKYPAFPKQERAFVAIRVGHFTVRGREAPAANAKRHLQRFQPP